MRISWFGLLRVTGALMMLALFGSGAALAENDSEAVKRAQCKAQKLIAVGELVGCLAQEAAVLAVGGPANFAGCSNAFALAFAAAESRGACAIEGDAPAVEARVDDFGREIFEMLGDAAPPAARP